MSFLPPVSFFHEEQSNNTSDKSFNKFDKTSILNDLEKKREVIQNRFNNAQLIFEKDFYGKPVIKRDPNFGNNSSGEFTHVKAYNFMNKGNVLQLKENENCNAAFIEYDTYDFNNPNYKGRGFFRVVGKVVQAAEDKVVKIEEMYFFPNHYMPDPENDNIVWYCQEKHGDSDLKIYRPLKENSKTSESSLAAEMGVGLEETGAECAVTDAMPTQFEPELGVGLEMGASQGITASQDIPQSVQEEANKVNQLGLDTLYLKTEKSEKNQEK